MAQIRSLDDLVKSSPEMNDQATLEGLAALLEKLAPLLQGWRLHNVVDLLSAVSDIVDMADDAMIQKLMKGYEELVAGAWMLGNSARFSMLQASQKPSPPTLWQSLKRLNQDADVRRGLNVALNFLGAVGRQARLGGEHLPED